jgi:16S rRNA (cytidine1402-2'-O)-methyltransferase
MSIYGEVYLIPVWLDDESPAVIPQYVVESVKKCSVFFVENERSARRFLKNLWKEIVIDEHQWFTIHKTEAEQKMIFVNKLKQGTTIGIISEAGCPGIADPGQILVAAAHEIGARVNPLVGPSAIILALMASGMNGQSFQFVGYLPVEQTQRIKIIKELELESKKKHCTQVFIETPYRNNQLIETVLKTCNGGTRFCIAADLTGQAQFIKTKTILEWKEKIPDLHKKPAMFCLIAE